MKLYQQRKAAGACVQCGKVDDRTANGKVCCAVCAQAKSESSRKFHQKCAAEHRCVWCGDRLPEQYYYVLCPSCREKDRQESAAYYQKKKTARSGNSEAVNGK